jgi:hypothetical protein
VSLLVYAGVLVVGYHCRVRIIKLSPTELSEKAARAGIVDNKHVWCWKLSLFRFRRQFLASPRRFSFFRRLATEAAMFPTPVPGVEMTLVILIPTAAVGLIIGKAGQFLKVR